MLSALCYTQAKDEKGITVVQGIERFPLIHLYSTLQQRPEIDCKQWNVWLRLQHPDMWITQNGMRSRLCSLFGNANSFVFVWCARCIDCVVMIYVGYSVHSCWFAVASRLCINPPRGVTNNESLSSSYSMHEVRCVSSNYQLTIAGVFVCKCLSMTTTQAVRCVLYIVLGLVAQW